MRALTAIVVFTLVSVFYAPARAQLSDPGSMALPGEYRPSGGTIDRFAQPALRDSTAEIRKLHASGRSEDALKLADTQLKSNPNDVQVLFVKGTLLQALGRISAAQSIFEGITVSYPELPEPYNNLAVIHAAQGRYQAALQALEGALRNRPDYAVALENKGDIYAKLALHAYERALAADSRASHLTDKISVLRRAAPSAPPKVSVAPADDAKRQKVIDTLNAWALSWGQHDVKSHLAHYALDFTPPQGTSAESFFEDRRESIKRRKSIKVQLDNHAIDFQGRRAIVAARQTYSADRIRSNIDKTFELALIDGQWKIVKEFRTQ